MSAALFVCFGNPTECIGCGGSVHADPPEGEARGPFEAPGGSQAPGRYCTEGCWADWEELMLREAEGRRRLTALCPECGFDRQEHDDGCRRARVPTLGGAPL